MLEPRDRIIVAVSGGADSMCLLSVLTVLRPDYDLTLFAVHVNHCMRGTDADADETYVKDYCEREHIELQICTVDVKKLAREQKVSLEEAGRHARYEAFESAAKQFSCNKIAVAHHKGDTAETVLFHLFRGTGLKGMCGIPPVRDKIIRPLLLLEREEIEDYLISKGIGWCTDHTNLEDDYSRNKIRNQILTYARKEINPRAIGHIAALSMQMRELHDFITEETKKAYEKTVVHTESSVIVNAVDFISLSPVIQKELIMFLLFEDFSIGGNITERHIADVLTLMKKQTGKQISLPQGIIVKRCYEGIVFLKNAMRQEELYKDDLHFCQEVRIPGIYELPWLGKKLRLSLIDYKNYIIIPKNKYTKWFDYDKIVNAVKLRRRKKEDYLIISKEGGRKSLKSFFIDNKIPKEERDEILVLADGSNILLVPGLRSGEGCHIDKQTTRVLTAELI